MKRLYAWLDKYILPWPVRFLTNPLVILFTFAMLIPLIGFANAVVFVLVANSYMNVTSVGTSSIVLRKQLLGEEAQELRAQQDHEAVMEILEDAHQILAELHDLHIGGRKHKFGKKVKV